MSVKIDNIEKFNGKLKNCIRFTGLDYFNLIKKLTGTDLSYDCEYGICYTGSYDYNKITDILSEYFGLTVTSVHCNIVIDDEAAANFDGVEVWLCYK